MNVLYVDPSSYKEHLSFNVYNLKVLQNICNISVFFKKDYLGDTDLKLTKKYECSLKCFPSDIYAKSKTKIGRFIKNKIGQFKICKRIMKIAKTDCFDLIIFGCVDIFVLSLLTKFSRLNIAFYEHGLYLTTLKKGHWIRSSWRFLNKKIKVILMEEYFYPYIRNCLHCKNRVFLIHHPIKTVDNQVAVIKSDIKIIFAPSLGNDESFVKSLVSNEDRIPKDYFIVIRSSFEYKSNRIHIYKNYLSREEYDNYSSECSYFLIIYDSRYLYRTSNVLFEGISRRKRILLLEGNTLNHYCIKYPSLFSTFNSFDGFVCCLNDLLTDQKSVDSFENDFNRFINEYSNDSLRESFEKLLNDEDYESDNDYNYKSN